MPSNERPKNSSMPEPSQSKSSNSPELSSLNKPWWEYSEEDWKLARSAQEKDLEAFAEALPSHLAGYEGAPEAE
ncbi:unnamed protein product [marine sediment metagenome]|uniref:Uncharacterized protein n=1 Tax=marine sediment metagenome TaxID=412755 RepID=X0TEX9_9ZZZZ